MHQLDSQRLLRLTGPTALANGEILEEDMVLEHTNTHATLIYASNHTNHHHKLYPNEVISHARFFLLLPQVRQEAADQKQDDPPGTWDYGAAQCRERTSGHHGKRAYFLDLHGAHQSWCLSAVGDRSSRHEKLKHLVAFFARLAGLRVTVEPPASHLLKGQAARDAFIKAFAKGDAKNLRLDLIISDDSRGREYEIDTTVPTSTAATHIARDVKAIKDKGDQFLLMSSKVAAHAELLKHQKYAPLLKAQYKEVKNRTRLVAPSFVAAVVTHAGHVGPDMTRLIETITAAYRKQQLPGCLAGRMDGQNINQLTAAFRHQMRTAIQFVVAKGTAGMFLSAGLEREHCKKFNI
jgi:hypothetical protein